MTVTPIHAAKLANAKRVVLEILTARQCMYPEEAARLVVDELRNLGWAPPGWRDDDAVPQPSSSDPIKRRQLIEKTKRELADRKRDRLAVDPREEPQ